MNQPIDLIEHPEGGRFLAVFRSDARITRSDGESRSALTHIYFSLNQMEVSRFHKVEADEVWNLYQGAVFICIFGVVQNARLSGLSYRLRLIAFAMLFPLDTGRLRNRWMASSTNSSKQHRCIWI